jgi:hypothetical protein
MTKRSVKQCAFASCDREETSAAIKIPSGIVRDSVVTAVPQIESPVVAPGFLLRLPPGAADIDHPPRLLLV